MMCPLLPYQGVPCGDVSKCVRLPKTLRSLGRARVHACCRPDLRLIMMSATVNASVFSEYFDGCATLTIPGFAFPVENFFLEDIIQLTRQVNKRMTWT